MQLRFNTPHQLILHQCHIRAALIIGAFAIVMALMVCCARPNTPSVPLAPVRADPEETIALVQSINDWLRRRPSAR
jgi:hypothetical protein